VSPPSAQVTFLYLHRVEQVAFQSSHLAPKVKLCPPGQSIPARQDNWEVLASKEIRSLPNYPGENLGGPGSPGLRELEMKRMLEGRMERRARALWMMGDAGPSRVIPSMDRLVNRMRDGVGLVLQGWEHCEARDCEVEDLWMVRVVGFGLEQGFEAELECFCLSEALLGALDRMTLF
jgi:hypothetical protein